MAPPRSKAQIEELISDCDSYREDMKYIQATIGERNVFIGQLTSEQSGQTEASFCVTVGMFIYNLPELVMSGVPTPLVRSIVEEMCEGHDYDREFLAGGRSKTIAGFTVVAVPVEAPDAQDVLNFCHDAYTMLGQGSVKAVQLVFADESGAFPWSPEYNDHERQYQPVLGMAGWGNIAN
jgi:hypothetical protein